ncbi:hypothetical protein B879_02215 [Cecembia lonarensis LW9]|uniref:Uncharacterized protein n=1 Tax=Cecembia lonarensis (strain CCUG 58316 / KCTC 22772 / LW9) TaxID=1225176 RepID=K1LA27_CECL9|nr:hypothetical protein B879_02215 [Cecembia lonarensis LW9]
MRNIKIMTNSEQVLAVNNETVTSEQLNAEQLSPPHSIKE